MYVLLRTLLLFVFVVAVLRGDESRVPRLFEYQSVLPETHPVSGSNVLVLDDMIVVGNRYALSSFIQRDLERFLNKRESVELGKKRRIEIVPDGREDMQLLFDAERLTPIRGSVNSGLDLKVRDVFLIDMPGGGVLKAQFRSGISIQMGKNTKFILRPSRKKLVSIRVDW